MSEVEPMAFDKTEMRALFKALKAMDDEAINESKKISGALAEYLKGKISISARSLYSRKVATRIADGSKVKKASRIGELSIGFASQKFSGGGTTQILWAGSEFGSNKFKQFPVWSGREGRGSKGWFIYPTLRREQPYIVREWESKFQDILKEWDK